MGLLFFLTMREEHSQRVFKKRVLRKTSGPEKEEVTGTG
jgi:hypothetical protein